MARGRNRRGSEHGEFWPAYVDVLSTLLLVVTLLMSLFMIAQYFAAQEASGKDSALKRLTRQITELTSLLNLEKGKSQEQRRRTGRPAGLARSRCKRRERAKLAARASGSTTRRRKAEAHASPRSRTDLDAQKTVSSEALAKVDLLNQQLLALRQQIAALNEALDASEKKGEDSHDAHQGSGAAPERGARAAGAGVAAVPLGLLRPSARSAEEPQGHPRRRRPLRVRKRGAVCVRVGHADA